MSDKTAAQLASTLNWLCDENRIASSYLHVAAVRAAAALLVTQEEALRKAAVALNAKRHTVEVSVRRQSPLAIEVSGMFVMVEPRIFWTRTLATDLEIEKSDRHWLEHVVRHHVGMAQNQHRDELLDMAAPLYAKAVEQFRKENPDGREFNFEER